MANERYILIPCSGRNRLNIQRGHVYKVKDHLFRKNIGFISKEVAEKKFGKNFRISLSDSLCPICSYDINDNPPFPLIKEN